MNIHMDITYQDKYVIKVKGSYLVGLTITDKVISHLQLTNLVSSAKRMDYDVALDMMGVLEYHGFEAGVERYRVASGVQKV